MPAVEAEQDAFLQSLQADYTQKIDWKVAKEGVDFADVPNFESYMPGLQPDPRPDQQVRDEVAGDAGARPRRRDRRPEVADAGDLGQGRQLIDGGPQRRASARAGPACRGWPGGARAGATSSSRRGSSGSCCSRRSRWSPRSSSRSPTSTSPRPTAPVRRPQELRRRCSPTSRRGTSLAVTFKFAAPGAAGRGHPAVARRADAPLATPARLERRSASCSSCRTSCRSWPAS